MKPVYATASPFVYFYGIAMTVALIMLASTVFCVFSRKTQRRMLWYLLFFWTCMPPAWFAVEYFVLYNKYGTPNTFEAFKYGQEVASKFWAGAIALVSAKLFQDREARVDTESLP